MLWLWALGEGWGCGCWEWGCCRVGWELGGMHTEGLGIGHWECDMEMVMGPTEEYSGSLHAWYEYCFGVCLDLFFEDFAG